MPNGKRTLVTKMAFSARDGARFELVKGWVKVTINLGDQTFTIWDNRQASLDACTAYQKACEDLLKAKRKKSKEEPTSVRERRNALQEEFWLVFQTPTEVEVEEQTVSGGERSVRYLTLYDTDEAPDTLLKVYRTSNRWMMDPYWENLAFVRDRKTGRCLLVFTCSMTAPTDIVEKDNKGVITKSVRFIGRDHPVVRTYQGKEAEIETEEEKAKTPEDERPKPPTDDEDILPESVKRALEPVENGTAGKPEPRRRRSKKTKEGPSDTEEGRPNGKKTGRRRPSKKEKE